MSDSIGAGETFSLAPLVLLAVGVIQMTYSTLTGENQILICIHGEFTQAWKFQILRQNWVYMSFCTKEKGMEGFGISKGK